MAETSSQFIRALTALLGYHRRLGIESYPAEAQLRRFLARPLPQPPPPPPSVEAAVVVPPVVAAPSEIGSPKRQAVLKSPDLLACQELAVEVGCCQACQLASRRIRAVAGRGGRQVRLLVVGDWLHLADSGTGGVDWIFGGEEDEMLRRMLTAIDLTDEAVFVTNVVKCGLAKDSQPTAEHIRACLSFLQRQIVLLQPQMVLAMGMVAAKALLDRSESLSQLRGKVLDFTALDGTVIPLIATFHPNYLRQNPEMKKATWADLQLLAKHLHRPTK